jgi:hypothetical protein
MLIAGYGFTTIPKSGVIMVITGLRWGLFTMKTGDCSQITRVRDADN